LYFNSTLIVNYRTNNYLKIGKASYKAYLGKMKENKIVHFVCFETTLGTERFIKRWEEYNRSPKCDLDVTLQRSEKNGVFRYIAQHRCTASELQFVFTKPARSSRIPQIGIKTEQVGGYSILHAERMNDAHDDESKVFVFLMHPQADLNNYRQLTTHSKLNIYEAYYENCQYAYILEFFVKNKYTAELFGQLNQYDAAEIGIYQECAMVAV
jgi:hypothetical protein